jgi:hypothetical protein
MLTTLLRLLLTQSDAIFFGSILPMDALNSSAYNRRIPSGSDTLSSQAGFINRKLWQSILLMATFISQILLPMELRLNAFDWMGVEERQCSD